MSSEDRFTIIPIIPEMGEYLKVFFEGYMEASELDSEITMTRHKIRLNVV